MFRDLTEECDTGTSIGAEIISSRPCMGQFGAGKVEIVHAPTYSRGMEPGSVCLC